MAAAFISKPGTEYGPCAEGCNHTDCAASRAMADGVCRLCGKPIGYEVRFYQDPESKESLVHAICLEKQQGAK